jgi:hypothetical protein
MPDIRKDTEALLPGSVVRLLSRNGTDWIGHLPAITKTAKEVRQES